MNTRYTELKNIAERFPFLKEKIAANIREVFSDEEFLDYMTFIKEYDYETDLFNISSKESRFSRGCFYSYNDDNSIPFDNKAMKLLYNLISSRDTSPLYEHHYDVLIKICNALIASFNVNENLLESKHLEIYGTREVMSDADKELANRAKGVAYIATCFAFSDPFQEYIRTVNPNTHRSQFFDDMLSDADTIKELNTLCDKINLSSRGKYFSYHIDKMNAFNALEAMVAKIYDSYSLEDIAKFKEKAAKYQYIFKYFGINSDREATILNNNISDEDRNSLVKDFTSADDIANLVKNVMTAFSSSGYFDGDKINSIITNIIVNNKKIRDRDFPATKNKVVHEFFRLLFVSGSGSRTFTNDSAYTAEIRKVVNKNREYSLDPYFITAMLIKSSVIAGEYRDIVKSTKAFITHIFSSKENNLEFIDNYLRELAKPEKERVSSVKGVKSNIISYGTLYYIVKKYILLDTVDINDYTGVNNTAFDPIKVLFFAYCRHRKDIASDLLEKTGAIKVQSGRYYYGYSDDGKESIVRVLDKILHSPRRDYDTRIVGHDGVVRNITPIDQIFNGTFAHIINYLTKETDDFFYCEDKCDGIRESSRYGSRSDKEIVPKDYYAYNSQAIKMVLIELYKYIVSDFSNELTPDMFEELKAFITQKDKTLTILPDTTFATLVNGSIDKKNSLNSEYVSDVTDYGCLNYITLSALSPYIAVIRDNRAIGNIFDVTVNDDLVLLPEMSTKFYDNVARKELNDRASAVMKQFNSLSKEEFEVIKPIIVDNFEEEFMFGRTMQVCLFANMINVTEGISYTYNSYNQYLVDSYSMQNDIAKPAVTPRAIDIVQVFYINVLYPKLVNAGIITQEQVQTIRNSFDKAYTDYECLLSLR